MAALHSAFHSIGPCSFSDVPKSSPELDEWLTKLFTDCKLILESVPIADPDESHTRARSQTTSSIASNASEMSSSSARSAPASPEHTALQKEWGKPIKLSAKENPLGMSVFKTSGKDGKGAWFARRSVHEGLGFARFKSGLQREFPESLAAGTAPGEGNVRGIGGEKLVEDIPVKDKGRIQTWQLSAQFPGPTTPRDFVTLLVTSSKAMDEDHQSKVLEIAPRHYMIISKPCNHPEAQPRAGYIRGQYESVEFIREVPRRSADSASGDDLQKRRQTDHSSSLEKDVLRRNAEKGQSLSLQHENRSTESLDEKRRVQFSESDSHSREMSPNSRKRAQTVGLPESSTHLHSGQDLHSEHYDPEENPIEWIMITRSDPGGSVPRFMVERGTPSSIVADASKFLNWACKKEDIVKEEPGVPGAIRPSTSQRRESFASWQANGTMAGLEHEGKAEEVQKGSPTGSKEAFPEIPSPESGETESQSLASSTLSARSPPISRSQDQPATASGIFGTVAGALSSYAPQAVLDHLPAGVSTPKTASAPNLVGQEEHPSAQVGGLEEIRPRSNGPEDDAASETSTLTFASADSHLGSDDDEPSTPSRSSPDNDRDSTKQSKPKDPTPEEKEDARFEKRKAALNAKLEAAKEKYAKDASSQNEKVRKAEEKHKKEVEKEEEKYRKQLAKQAERRQRDEKKEEEKRKKEADKDEKTKLTRERDESRKEADLLRKQVDLMSKQIGELQKENTLLTAKIGELGNGDKGTGVMKLVGEEKSKGSRSRSSSLKRLVGAEAN